MSEQTRSTQQHVIRLALALALVGLLTMLSGGLLLVLGENAAAEPGDKIKVGVCHRTASETNPYTYIEVPEDEANGHITGTSKQHNTHVVWKSDGTWRGVAHKANDPKLDYFAHEDEVAARKCLDPQVTPPEEPEQVTPESPTFSDTCDPDNEELVVPEDDGVVDYTVSARTGDTITVTAVSADQERFVLLDPTSGAVVDTVTWTFTVDDAPCPTETPTPTPTPPEVTPTTTPPEVAPTTGTASPQAEEQGEEPSEQSQEPEAPEVLPAQASQGPAQPGRLPTVVDAGYYTGWSTTQVWGVALLGGGIALLLSSGTVLTAARKE